MNKDYTVTSDGTHPKLVFVPENLTPLSEYYIAYRLEGMSDAEAIQLVRGLSESSLYAFPEEDEDHETEANC